MEEMCMHNRYGRCLALTVDSCKNPKECAFFKTKTQYNRECAKCEERLRKLHLVYDENGLNYIGG